MRWALIILLSFFAFSKCSSQQQSQPVASKIDSTHIHESIELPILNGDTAIINVFNKIDNQNSKCDHYKKGRMCYIVGFFEFKDYLLIYVTPILFESAPQLSKDWYLGVVLVHSVPFLISGINGGIYFGHGKNDNEKNDKYRIEYMTNYQTRYLKDLCDACSEIWRLKVGDKNIIIEARICHVY
jgi:hypothetical protein